MEQSLSRIAVVGDYLPRRCGIATFTSDLLATVAAGHPQCPCLVVPVKDIKDRYELSDVVRFEIEEKRRVMEEVLRSKTWPLTRREY
jgi:hypothetical protein